MRVLAAAVLVYFLLALLLQPPLTSLPYRLQVTLSTAAVNDDAVIAVARISERTSPSSFRVNVWLNGSYGRAVMMPTTNQGTVRIVSMLSDSEFFNVTVGWTDTNGDGMLSSGDYFTVSAPGGLSRPGSYAFYLIWAANGALLASAEFATS